MDMWHYPRPDLVADYMKMFELGISSNLAIIAPRRKGKTLFVLKDFAPFAQKQKYLPVYASLWQNINAPHEGLAVALEEAIDAIDKKARVSRILNSKIRKAAVTNELLGKVELEFASQPIQPSSSDLIYLEKLLATLQEKAGKRQVLLMIDEVQHLATHYAFDALTHSLRTMLDKRQGKIKTLFTGSSRHYMNLLFNASESPFYHFVESVPFPDLDEDFIRFLRSKLANEHQIAVAIQPLMKAFQQTDSSPYWMMKLIAHLVTYKVSVNDAVKHITQTMEAAEGYEQVVSSLKPIDKLVFLALCNSENPYSKALLQTIEETTELKGIASNVQRSIQRLTGAHIISQIRKGEYLIEKPGLRRYLESKKN